MEEATAPLYDLIRRDYPPITSIVNFDCLRYGDERFITECNARITFSAYVQEIRRTLLSARAIALDHQVTEDTCLVRKITLSSTRDFESLRVALGSTLLTDPSQTGIIPIVLGCLATAGYCYFVAVADSYQDALEVMAEARMKLGVK